MVNLLGEAVEMAGVISLTPTSFQMEGSKMHLKKFIELIALHGLTFHTGEL